MPSDPLMAIPNDTEPLYAIRRAHGVGRSPSTSLTTLVSMSRTLSGGHLGESLVNLAELRRKLRNFEGWRVSLLPTARAQPCGRFRNVASSTWPSVPSRPWVHHVGLARRQERPAAVLAVPVRRAGQSSALRPVTQVSLVSLGIFLRRIIDEVSHGQAHESQFRRQPTLTITSHLHYWTNFRQNEFPKEPLAPYPLLNNAARSPPFFST